MTPPALSNTMIRTVGIVGNHAPRQCGIAAFTTDLREALASACPSLDSFVVAMNDPGRVYAYPPAVRCEIAECESVAYRRAAEFLNHSGADVVSLQHEYGIFGGRAGSDIVPLLQSLRVPVVTTLHTVLAEPDPSQRAVLDAIARVSSRLVVMSAHGVALLREVYGVPGDKIDLIPHGVPTLPPAADSKARLGLSGRPVILTFGLLGPNKGIEYVLDAMPTVLEHHPEAVYLVLGTTHPHLREREGESYRTALVARARSLGIEGHVVFHDRFVRGDELAEFVAAADLVVTPYLKPEQITAGTLAYAVGCGKAVISTPYWYARELLANGRGVLVAWRDPASIARAANTLLRDPASAESLRARAAAYGGDMAWPNVARRYLESFEQARAGHTPPLRTVSSPYVLLPSRAERPEVDLRHMRNLTDDTGILRHAVFDVPNYADGYCLDDNARALILTTQLAEAGTEGAETLRTLSARYLAFVRHAFDDTTGRFRNLLSYARTWLEEGSAEDSHGRALWSLGTVVGRAEEAGHRSLARQLFHAALGPVKTLTSPRAWAYALLGIDAYLQAQPGDREVQGLRRTLSADLLDLHARASRPEWPWFEDRVTTCSPRLCQALLVSGTRMGDARMTATGLDALEWLVTLQRTHDGLFCPVGPSGVGPGDDAQTPADPRPLEAACMVSACLDASRATGDPRWREHARLAFGWFLGQNHLRRSLYDPSTGGCRDGLAADRLNEDQGAEATVSFLQALLEMRALDRAATARIAWAHEATP